MGTLWIILKLNNCDMLLLNCGWIHDYELWLLLNVVVNVISWFGYELSWVVVVWKKWIVVVVVKDLMFRENHFQTIS